MKTSEKIKVIDKQSLNPPPDEEEEILIPFSLLSSPAGFSWRPFPCKGSLGLELADQFGAGCPQGWKVWKNFMDV